MTKSPYVDIIYFSARQLHQIYQKNCISTQISDLTRKNIIDTLKVKTSKQCPSELTSIEKRKDYTKHQNIKKGLSLNILYMHREARNFTMKPNLNFV